MLSDLPNCPYSLALTSCSQIRPVLAMCPRAAVSVAFICIDSRFRCDANPKQLQLFAIKCNRMQSFIHSHSHSLMLLPLRHIGHGQSMDERATQGEAATSSTVAVSYPLSLSFPLCLFLSVCLTVSFSFGLPFPFRSLDSLCTCQP